jgi:outer membrane protein assembly factor BamB
MDIMSCIRKHTIVLGLFVVCIGFVFGADWPHWRGPNYDGISTETNWDPAALGDGSVVWEAQVGIGFSAVSVANGKAYTAGNVDKNTDIIYCFDAATGKELWTHKYPESLTANMYEGGPNATPTIHDGKVYMISKTGTVFCLNADTGKEVWNRSLPHKKPQWGFAGSPVVVGDLVIFNVGSAGVALNKQSGEIVWESGDDTSGYSSAVPFKKDGTQYIASFGKESVQIIEALTGNETASYEWKTSYNVNAADPVISGDELLITSGYGHGVALLKMSAEGLEKVWENKNMRSQMSGPVLIDGYLYGFDDKKLVCLDWKSGQQKWEEKTPKKGSLSAAGDKLIVLSEKGMLSIAQATPQGYQQIASAQVLDGRCWTMPVLSNGRIYARNAKGHLVCVDVQKKNEAPLISAVSIPTTDANWPQWQGPNRDNISTETGLLKQWPEAGPTMLWSANGLGHGYSSPAIADGKIYITGAIENEGQLTCFDLDGNKLWATDYGPEWKRSFPGTRCTPTVDNGLVYVTSGTGQAACFKAQTGEPVWKRDVFGQFEGQYPHWGFAECPLIVEDKLIVTVGGNKALFVALNKKDGSVIWTTPANGDKSAFCSPAAFEWAGKTMITNMTENHIVGIDAQTGGVLFSYPVSNYITERIRGTHPNTPIVTDGKIFVSSGYDMGSIQLKLSADGTSVEKVWVNPEFDNHHGGIVLIGGKLYGANWQSNKQGKWVCVDWETGKTLYEQEWGNKGSLSYADGMLYCYEEKSGTVGLVKATPAGFNPISTFKITQGEKEHWPHPVICGKRLYIRHGDILMAFDIAGES